jgi:hypothetical protein
MPIKKLTSAVDTMAGPCEDETTTLDTTMAPHGELAWSIDDDDDEEPQRRSWEDAGSAAAVLLVGGVAAAVAVYVAIASSHHNDVQASSAPSARVAVTPPSAPSAVTTVTQSPVTVTVTPAPTTAPATTAAAAPSPLIVLTQPTTTTTWRQPMVFTAAQDQALLRAVRAKDSEREIVDGSPALVVREAHHWCLLVSQGSTGNQADDTVQAETGWSEIDTTLLIGDAIRIYPGCY